LSILIIISNSKCFSAATISGLKLFFTAVFPGLFPFMILTKLLTEIGFIYKLSSKLSKFSHKLFGTPGISMYVMFMSAISGYPIGAKIIGDLYNKKLITQKDAEKMSIFCTTSGPIFIIGAVGVGMLGNAKFGLIIYISHIISSILLGLAFNFFSKKEKTISNEKLVFVKNKNIISNSVNETINAILIVGAYITIFYLFSEMLTLLNLIPNLASFLAKILKFTNTSKNQIEAIIYGIIEVTHGCKALSVLSPQNLPIICGIISFSGISIIMQSMAFLNQTKIKAHTFICYKCVHCILSILVCKLFITIL